jgi:hypothetical protein
MPEPEIIPPRRDATGSRIDDESLEALTRLLDDVFCIPGTNLRFGIDALIGLIPGIGDLITGLASFFIIYAAWQRGLSRVTILRMTTNVAIDTLLGSVPVLGDVFDAAWKSNRMNLKLLQREKAGASKKHTAMDALFLAAIAAVALVLLASPFLVIWLLLRGH